MKMQGDYFHGAGAGGGGYGGLGFSGDLAARKAQFFLPERRRLNSNSVLLSFCLPWGLFCGVMGLLSFFVHYHRPLLCWAAVLGALALVLLCGSYAYEHRLRKAFAVEREPSWVVFLFLSMSLAWTLGLSCGMENYTVNMEKYYHMKDLHTYDNIYPDRQRGQTIMDVGIATFTSGSFVDVLKGAAFNNLGMYCVAPISNNRNNTLGIYDFWVAGKDCCTASQGSFRCGESANSRARGALRLVDGDLEFYRLALMKAEATYNIKSLNPIFFEWVVDAPELVEDRAASGVAEFLRRVVQYGCLQAALVAVAAAAFSRITLV